MIEQGRRAGRSLHTQRALLLALLLLAGVPSQLWAHPKLKRSTPSAGDSVRTALTEVRLAFDEPVEAAISTLALLAPDGRRIVLQVRYGEPGVSTVLTAPLTQPLAPGTYTLTWKVAGGDGHPVRGKFSFVVTASASNLVKPSAEPPPNLSHHPATSSPDDSGPGLNSLPNVLVRWFTFASLVVLIGVLGFQQVVLRLIRRRAASTHLAVAASGQIRAATLGLGAAILLLVSAGARLVAQAVAMQDPGEAITGEGVAAMLLQTVWGWGWLLQVGATGLALISFLQVGRGKQRGWVGALAATVILAFTPALAGHAAAVDRWQPLPFLADGLHVLGAGGWLGTLFVVLLAGLPAAMQLEPSQGRMALADLANAFSPVALVCAGLAAATGLFAAWIHLGTLPALWQSAYGRTLLLKLAVLAGVAATGAYNWRVVRPSLAKVPATGPLRRSAGLELVIATIVIAITAVLVATPPPREPM